MSWLLALPLLLVAAVVALLPVALLLRRPVSLPYLVAETFVTALAHRRGLAGDQATVGSVISRTSSPQAGQATRSRDGARSSGAWLARGIRAPHRGQVSS
jgi:hypothetical protein